MTIKIYDKTGTRYYVITKSDERNCIYIKKQDGEGASFNAAKIGYVLFEAIDKFFKENF